MILAHQELFESIENGSIICEPFLPENVGTNSIDVRLGRTLVEVLPNFFGAIDMNYPAKTRKVPMRCGRWLIKPGRLYLGHTIEVIGSTDYVPVMHGRSTPARSGLSPIVSAGYGDIGFIGQWVLEITTAAHQMWIAPGMRIAQIEFSKATSNAVQYGIDRQAHYANQRGIVPGLHKNI